VRTLRPPTSRLPTATSPPSRKSCRTAASATATPKRSATTG
jgi:hypothetical protein